MSHAAACRGIGPKDDPDDPSDMTDRATPGRAIAPPASRQERVDWLRLIRSRRVGPATFYRLVDECGSAAEALRALPEIAAGAGEAAYRVCPEGVAEAEIRAGEKIGARLLAFGAAEYPRLLAELADPPPILWSLGDPALMLRPAVAVIGARNASSLGARMARAIARDLAEAGIVVVSGLARGIDTEAHRAALGGGTVAVMAGGIDVVYPSENADLAGQIGEAGLIVTEQPPGMQPTARHFPRRNRIVSGLCRAVVVVEAAAKSGSLITARTALDQGREVLAVPGHPFDARAAGCNMLIRDGATLVRGGGDVIEALGGDTARVRTAGVGRPAAPAPSAPVRDDPDDLGREILSRLGPSPVAEDQLIRELGLTAAAVAPELTTLELDGRIRRHPGGLVSLA
jgi:DNA processing protein